MINKKVSLQYFAGLVDGEGCIDSKVKLTKKGEKRYCRLRIALKEEDCEILFSIKEQYGGNMYYVKTQKGWKDHWKPQWRWEVNGEKAKIIIKRLIPYLRIKKLKAIKEIS